MKRLSSVALAATALVPLLSVLSLLAGCGQKGPLYLPAPVAPASAGAR